MSLSLDDLGRIPGLAGTWRTPEPSNLDVQITGIGLLGIDEPDAEAAVLLAGAQAPEGPPPPGCVAFLVRDAPDSRPALPTYVLHPDTALLDAMSAVKQALGGPGGLEARARARQALRQLATVEATAEDVAQCAAELLGAPLAILDEHLDVLGVSGASLAQREELTSAIDAARGRGPASPIGVFERATLEGAIQHPVVRGREPVGMVIAWVGDEIAPDQAAILEEIDAAVLGMRSRDAVRLATEAQLKGDFIEELSTGDA